MESDDELSGEMKQEFFNALKEAMERTIED